MAESATPASGPERETIWTIGHSTREWQAFSHLLRREEINVLGDVRAYPGSRRYPWFDRQSMEDALAGLGIHYHHLPDLGGRRRAPADAPPTAWRNASFHAYAHWMRTADFERALDALLDLRRQGRTAIMCSEAVPWRCHRNLIADALLARGTRVLHIGDTATSPHAMTSFAVVEDGRVRYPPQSAGEEQQLDLPV